MPEGDSIHRAAINLERALAGRPITRFETAYAQLARVDDDAPIVGRSVESVRAQGKHLLIRLSGRAGDPAAPPLTLRTHMRMNGSWHIYRPEQRWQRARAEMRILLGTEAYLAVAFAVPVAEFLGDAELPRAPALRRLGPDLLGATLDRAEAVRRLRARGDEPLAEVLLDQSVVAGAGNVYRSELMFLVGLDPSRPAAGLPEGDLDRLLDIAHRLMRANVDGRGAYGRAGIVTRAALGRSAERGRGANHWVYGRRGQPCRRCGTPIAYRKTGVHARGLYYCPTCQR